MSRIRGVRYEAEDETDGVKLPDWEEERVQKLAEWLGSPDSEPFKEACGWYVSKSGLRLWAMALRRIPKYFGNAFPMFKDDTDRMRCDIVHRVLAGEDVPKDDVRLAVLLMVQGFNAQCDRIHYMEQALNGLRRTSRPLPYRRS